MSDNSAQLAVKETASDDLALVHASKAGDVSAFEELVKRYDRKLLRIAQNLMHNREDAEDVVQEAFLKAFLHLDQFREDSKFSTWLIRITLNQSLMKLRKQKTTREVSLEKDFQSEEDANPIDVGDWAPNPEELYRATELREILRKTLEELSQGLRVVFVLRDMEGLSLAQTAEALDLSLTAVKARSFRARLQLRERLSKYFKKRKKLRSVEPHSGLAEPAELERRKSVRRRLWDLATEASLLCFSYATIACRDSAPTLLTIQSPATTL